MWEVVENVNHDISGAFSVRFLWFFLLNVIYLVYEILVQSFTEFRSAVVKLCEKWVVENANHDISGAFLVRFLWFFFLNVIYLGYEILLQSFTEFRSAVVKLCEKWGVENANHDISGAFLVRFLWFFLLNAIYLGYKIRLRSFARLRSVYVELCGSCVKMPVLHFRVCFLSDFFHFFFC